MCNGSYNQSINDLLCLNNDIQVYNKNLVINIFKSGIYPVNLNGKFVEALNKLFYESIRS